MTCSDKLLDSLDLSNILRGKKIVFGLDTNGQRDVFEDLFLEPEGNKSFLSNCGKSGSFQISYWNYVARRDVNEGEDSCFYSVLFTTHLHNTYTVTHLTQGQTGTALVFPFGQALWSNDASNSSGHAVYSS